MSGPFGSSQWMYASGGFYPYEIEQSLRFNDDDSAYLSWTPASAGNRKTWTWSAWVKRGNLGTTQMLFQGGTSAQTSAIYIRFNSSDQLQIVDGPNALHVQTTAVFRDPSAWMHIVFAFDTTQATSSDRVKIYVNGVLQTNLSVAAYPALDAAGYHLNNTNSHQLGGQLTGPTSLFDGYMAEVNFIDGLALDPTSFGEFKSGVWIPKKYTGSYGTNGFYLSFADSAAIGDDLSGNANDWTPSGLASTDVLLDSPTENYCVLNPLFKNSTMILSDGNLRANGGAATYPLAGTIVLPETGKWYAEFTVVSDDTTGFPQVGLVDLSTNFNSNTSIHTTKGVSYSQNGNVFRDGVSVSTGAGTFTTSDVIGVAYDADTREVWFSKNNVWVLSGDPAAGTSPAVTANAPVAGYAFGVSAYNIANVACNFGQSSFAYTPPAGFLALNTANLPEPTISPALDDVPADYFNTVLYTGTGAAQSITGVGFQPDWTWIKGRSGATDHGLYDAVRGVQLQLESNTNAAETTETTGLTAFGTDGFTVGALAQLNTSSATYVAWNWKAAGAGVSNTDGTITSTVSALPKSGFSIVSYTGNGTAGATVGHGLGVAPAMIIHKAVDDGTYNWNSWHQSLATDHFVSLNTTNGQNSSFLIWPTAGINSSVFTTGSGSPIFNNLSGQDHIAYCFAEVEGYSKFGSYTGNGSADGPFVWCGFRPAFVMVKRIDVSGENWWVLDTVRGTYNVMGPRLSPNLSNAEATGVNFFDIVSNGFKVRDSGSHVNTSGGTYIFAAFAEMPAKYSLGR